MKGLFVTDGRLDERAWSGTSMSLYREIGRHFDLVAVEQVVPGWYDLCNKVVNHLPWRKRLAADRTLPWRRHSAAEVAAACERDEAEFVFAPGSLPIALVDVGVPLFCYIDGTVQVISKSYGGWEQSDIAKANALEQDALSRAAYVFCASDWVARSVVNDYGVDLSRIGVVGIGANNEIPVGDFDCVVDARLESFRGGVRILFVGVDWKRKGGPDALETLRLLQAAGVPATLDIVGCEPEIPEDLEGCVTVHGFLSKKDFAERQELEELYLDSHFFLLPTKAECVGSVFCEASSAGLPVLTRGVGGVPAVVEDGVNGFLLDGPRAFANMILRFSGDGEAYRTLQKSSRELFLRRLNWRAIGDGMTTRIETITEGIEAGGERSAAD